MNELKPGRELDALVAEKVMGCRVKRWDSGEVWCDCEDRPHAIDGEDGLLAEYSTNISNAWDVIVKLREIGRRATSLGSVLHFTEKPYWSWVVKVEWTDSLKGYRWEMGLSDSASHAICLAALKAVGA